MYFLKAGVYALLIYLNILHLGTTLNYLVSFLLVGAIFADSKNVNVRNLLLVIAVCQILTLLLLETSYLFLMLVQTKATFLLDGAVAALLLLSLYGMRLGVYYRVEISNYIRLKLDMPEQKYDIVFADNVILKVLSLYQFLVVFGSAVLVYYGYLYYEALSSQADYIQPLFEQYIGFGQQFWEAHRLLLLLFDVFLLLSLTTGAQTIDTRTYQDGASL